MAFKSFTLKKKKSSSHKDDQHNSLDLQREMASMQQEIENLKSKLHDEEQENKNLNLSLVIEKQRHQAETQKLDEKIQELKDTIETFEKQNKYDMLWSTNRIFYSETVPQKLISRLPVEIHVMKLDSNDLSVGAAPGAARGGKSKLHSVFGKNKTRAAKTKSGHTFNNLTDAIKLAHDYADATKIEIIVCEGTFDVDGQITVNRPNVKFRGQGSAKSILRMQAGTIVFEEEANNSTFSGIGVVRGNSRFKQPLIRVYKANTIISECELDGGDCYIAGDERNSAFTVSQSSGYSSTTTEENMKQQLLHQPAQILNTVIHHSAGYGIMLYHYSSAIVMDCDIHHCRDSGIMVTQMSDPLIHSNKIHDNSQCGIVIRASSGVIEINDIFGNGSDGVEATSQASPLLRGNTLKGNGRFAISINGESKGRIEPNTMTDNVRGKVEVQEGSQPEIIVENGRDQKDKEERKPVLGMSPSAAVEDKGKEKKSRKSKSKTKEDKEKRKKKKESKEKKKKSKKDKSPKV